MGKFLEVIEDASKLSNSISLTSNGVSRFPYNFSKIRYEDPVKTGIHQLLLEAFLKAERKLPGGSVSVIDGFYAQIQKSEKVCTKNINSISLKKRLVDDFGTQVTNLCFTAAELSGLDGKIFLKKKNVTVPTIELKSSFKFDCNSPTGEFELLDCKVLILDGFIESVTQIHRLLTELSETGQECLLFCRGMSPDVTNTISVNLKRSLRLRPLIIPFNESGINTLKDIAVISNSTLYSSDLGHTVSSVSIDKNSKNLKVRFNGGQIYVETQSVDQRTKDHLNDLRDRMESCQEEFTLELYRKRIESLSGRQVTIMIPEGVSSYILTQNIDSCLRKMRGLINLGDMSEEQGLMLLSPIIDSLKEYSRQFEEGEGLHHELFIA